MSEHRQIFSDEAIAIYQRIRQAIGVADTNDKQNALLSIEKKHYPYIWGRFKKIAKQYQIKLPMAQELWMDHGNELLPLFFDIAELSGTDKIETSKHLTQVIKHRLQDIIDNGETETLLKEKKALILEEQDDIVRLSGIPASHHQ